MQTVRLGRFGLLVGPSLLCALVCSCATTGPSRNGPNEVDAAELAPAMRDAQTAEGVMNDAGDASTVEPSDASGDGERATWAAVRWLGRVDMSSSEGPRFGWQGTGFSARIEGPRVAVRLRNESGDVVLFQATIDGRLGPRFAFSGDAPATVELATGLATGEHIVELFRETEGQFGATVFLGFASGRLLGPTAAPVRRMEAVGDSITAGYGNLGREEHGERAPPGCTWSAQNSSWYQTYAAIAARAVDAELTTIARSGWGVFPSQRPEPNGGIPAVYANALGVQPGPKWAFRNGVDAIVINLGTNDWGDGDPGVRFERAYHTFLDEVRRGNPSAWIFLTIGSMFADPELAQVKAHLSAIVAQRVRAGDSKISSFDLGTQDAAVTGCDWHPNVADHERMARILERELRAKLGW